VKFQVFKNGQQVKDFTLSGAYLFGTDGVAIRKAQIEFKNNLIDCRKPTTETAGLALLWPIEKYGKVMLPTTCLPERERPYILNVEIARAKLMQIVNKREDWAYFNGINGFTDNSDEAIDKFIEAIQNISEPSKAAKVADEAILKAVEFCEKLAVKQAETVFAKKVGARGFNRGCLGCTLDPDKIDNSAYVNSILGAFGLVTIPFNWKQIEPRPGRYDFSKIDKCIKAIVKKKLLISAGPLLSFTEQSLPKWLIDSGAKFEKIREAAYRFVTKAVSRYSGVVRGWRVVSGLNAFNYFCFNFEQVLEMTRAAAMAAKASSPRALKIIEISNPWGEYYATAPHTIPPLVYIDMVIQSGINFDAFGLRLPLGKAENGMQMRDMLQLSSVLDYFSPIAKPLYVTDIAVPSIEAGGRHHGDVAGIWQAGWDETQQALWLERFCKIALSKPFINAVTYANLIDNDNNVIAGSGLMTDDFRPKKSYEMLKRLQSQAGILTH